MTSNFDIIMENARRHAESQPAPIPQTVQDRALIEAARIYQSILEQEGRKSETFRNLETAQAKEAALANEYEGLIRNATLNAPRIAEIEPQLKQLQADIAKYGRELSAQPQEEPIVNNYPDEGERRRLMEAAAAEIRGEQGPRIPTTNVQTDRVINL